ncbi:MAG: hypothetical protein DRI39_10795 [Chloroflexi bacterium]|nr:MAG: hypothetical protein DRI39_10795 [Chloroflexota bacterium]
MTNGKRWPKPGDRLVHTFRKRPGEVVAEVAAADSRSGRVAVRVEGKEYPTLSAAAAEIAGHATNGWVFWGLKQQERVE